MNMPIALAPVDRILRKAGAERVSRDAALELREIVENFAHRIAKEAVKRSSEAGRKTVFKEDVLQAPASVVGRVKENILIDVETEILRELEDLIPPRQR
ncbi:MAG: NFYB/HAP3 family transcription factor subunit [Theionarchaea archaeon]|jgi:histone H3/H4|nr:NFYB/HAP3 family transcription factor subunit [Theionarchaea archaeon]